MKITIDIDESLVPEGYEVVRVDTTVNVNDYYFEGNGALVKCQRSIRFIYPIPIFKKKRWRAEKGEPYEYISDVGRVRRVGDAYTHMDNIRHELGNYYDPDTSEAEKAAERVRAAYVGESE